MRIQGGGQTRQRGKRFLLVAFFLRNHFEWISISSVHMYLSISGYVYIGKKCILIFSRNNRWGALTRAGVFQPFGIRSSTITVTVCLLAYIVFSYAFQQDFGSIYFNSSFRLAHTTRHHTIPCASRTPRPIPHSYTATNIRHRPKQVYTMRIDKKHDIIIFLFSSCSNRG